MPTLYVHAMKPPAVPAPTHNSRRVVDSSAASSSQQPHQFNIKGRKTPKGSRAKARAAAAAAAAAPQPATTTATATGGDEDCSVNTLNTTSVKTDHSRGTAVSSVTGRVPIMMDDESYNTYYSDVSLRNRRNKKLSLLTYVDHDNKSDDAEVRVRSQQQQQKIPPKPMDDLFADDHGEDGEVESRNDMDSHAGGSSPRGGSCPIPSSLYQPDPARNQEVFQTGGIRMMGGGVAREYQKMFQQQDRTRSSAVGGLVLSNDDDDDDHDGDSLDYSYSKSTMQGVMSQPSHSLVSQSSQSSREGEEERRTGPEHGGYNNLAVQERRQGPDRRAFVQPPSTLDRSYSNNRNDQRGSYYDIVVKEPPTRPAPLPPPPPKPVRRSHLSPVVEEWHTKECDTFTTNDSATFTQNLQDSDTAARDKCSRTLNTIVTGILKCSSAFKGYQGNSSGSLPNFEEMAEQSLKNIHTRGPKREIDRPQPITTGPTTAWCVENCARRKMEDNDELESSCEAYPGVQGHLARKYAAEDEDEYTDASNTSSFEEFRPKMVHWHQNAENDDSGIDQAPAATDPVSLLSVLSAEILNLTDTVKRERSAVVPGASPPNGETNGSIPTVDPLALLDKLSTEIRNLTDTTREGSEALAREVQSRLNYDVAEEQRDRILEEWKQFIGSIQQTMPSMGGGDSAADFFADLPRIESYGIPEGQGRPSMHQGSSEEEDDFEDIDSSPVGRIRSSSMGNQMEVETVDTDEISEPKEEEIKSVEANREMEKEDSRPNLYESVRKNTNRRQIMMNLQRSRMKSKTPKDLEEKPLDTEGLRELYLSYHSEIHGDKTDKTDEEKTARAADSNVDSQNVEPGGGEQLKDADDETKVANSIWEKMQSTMDDKKHDEDGLSILSDEVSTKSPITLQETAAKEADEGSSSSVVYQGVLYSEGEEDDDQSSNQEIDATEMADSLVEEDSAEKKSLFHLDDAKDTMLERISEEGTSSQESMVDELNDYTNDPFVPIASVSESGRKAVATLWETAKHSPAWDCSMAINESPPTSEHKKLAVELGEDYLEGKERADPVLISDPLWQEEAEMPAQDTVLAVPYQTEAGSIEEGIANSNNDKGQNRPGLPSDADAASSTLEVNCDTSLGESINSLDVDDAKDTGSAALMDDAKVFTKSNEESSIVETSDISMGSASRYDELGVVEKHIQLGSMAFESGARNIARDDNEGKTSSWISQDGSIDSNYTFEDPEEEMMAKARGKSVMRREVESRQNPEEEIGRHSREMDECIDSFEGPRLDNSISGVSNLESEASPDNGHVHDPVDPDRMSFDESIEGSSVSEGIECTLSFGPAPTFEPSDDLPFDSEDDKLPTENYERNDIWEDRLTRSLGPMAVKENLAAKQQSKPAPSSKIVKRPMVVTLVFISLYALFNGLWSSPSLESTEIPLEDFMDTQPSETSNLVQVDKSEDGDNSGFVWSPTDTDTKINIDIQYRKDIQFFFGSNLDDEEVEQGEWNQSDWVKELAKSLDQQEVLDSNENVMSEKIQKVSVEKSPSSKMSLEEEEEEDDEVVVAVEEEEISCDISDEETTLWTQKSVASEDKMEVIVHQSPSEKVITKKPMSTHHGRNKNS